MKTPIIVNEKGDINIYRTTDEAALCMEAVDVINNEYSVYDGNGFVLQALAFSEDDIVTLVFPEGSANEASTLCKILRDYIARVGVGRFGVSSETVEELNLADLIQLIYRFQREANKL